jgi:excisionase family DNA binding protein
VRTAYRRSSAPDCPSSVRGCPGCFVDSEKKTKDRSLANRLALRPAEVAEALGLSERTVRQILPELPHIRVGTAVVVPIDQLRDWLRERAHQEKSAVDQAVEDMLEQLGE